MNFTRAFAYIFEDRDWPTKVITMALVTAAALLLTPVLVGLALWAVILGYQSDLVRNWRAGSSHLLPAWGHVQARLTNGANILAAIIVYNLPNILLGCCMSFVAPTVSNTFTGAGTTLLVACCLFPALLLYNLAIWPMLALGLAFYQDEGRIGAFFEFGRLFGLARTHSDLTVQYLITSAFVGLIFTLLSATVIGVLLVLALATPVTGALTGQYTLRIVGKPRLPVPAPRPYR